MALNIDKENLKVVDGVLTKFVDNSCEEMVIPEGVIELAKYSVSSVSASVLRIPSTVEVVRKCAILCAHHITTLCIENPQIYLEVGSIESLSNLKELYIGGQRIDSVITQEGGDVNCIYLEKYIGNDKSYSIDKDINAIGSKAFLDCKTLESVEFSQSVRYIDIWAFSGCSSLKEIIMTNSIKSISGYVFENCTSIRELTIPQSVYYIGYGAFRGWTRNQIIRVPSSFKKLRFLQKWRKGCKATIIYY